MKTPTQVLQAVGEFVSYAESLHMPDRDEVIKLTGEAIAAGEEADLSGNAQRLASWLDSFTFPDGSPTPTGLTASDKADTITGAQFFYGLVKP